MRRKLRLAQSVRLIPYMEELWQSHLETKGAHESVRRLVALKEEVTSDSSALEYIEEDINWENGIILHAQQLRTYLNGVAMDEWVRGRKKQFKGTEFRKYQLRDALECVDKWKERKRK